MQIRLEKDVAVAIKRLAKKEGRSVPKQVNMMLRLSVKPIRFEPSKYV